MHFDMQGDMEVHWRCGGGSSRVQVQGLRRHFRRSMGSQGVHAFVTCRGGGPLVAMNTAVNGLRKLMLDQVLVRELDRPTGSRF